MARHNGKILSEDKEVVLGGKGVGLKMCNCQVSKRKDCPIPGLCNENGVIYQAKVTSVSGAVGHTLD